ncbi:MAG: UvrD-helicase domain-containing protein [Coriobacteriia bacterium]|nr:UvrD-helicase domain-containing protein [Coriobacteriia bacterium]
MSYLLDDLNPAQRDAVMATDGPLLVLAGAGSGKTRVLTYRIAHLIAEKRVSPADILAITFTNKAAQEMRRRLEALVGPGVRAMWVMTFHAMCVRILRGEAHRLGYTRNFSIYDGDDSKRMISAIMADLEIDPKNVPVKMISGRISSAKNELIGPARYAEDAAMPPMKITAKVYPLYQQRLRAANAMDFDDLLVNAHRLFAEHPEVLAFYQDRFRYIHVDEYQDTNHAQYSIVNLLAAKHRNLMVVGDDDQSIYSWRGADIRNILEFEHDYPEATVIKLEQNYRSTQTILTAANAVVANNAGRKPKTLWTANVGGEAITRYYASDEKDEARFVGQEVERLLREEHRGYDEFAVFYRTNAQSRTLEDIFLRMGVPYRLVGGTRFFERAEIKDVMSWLRAVVNPADIQSVERLLAKRQGIGKTTVDTLKARSYESDITLSETIERAAGEDWLSTAPRRKVAELAVVLAETRALEAEKLRDRVEEIVKCSGLLSALAAEDTSEAEGRAENIHEFFGVVQEYDETHEEEERTLEAFLEWMALRTDLDQLAEEDRSVTLMTLHTAKGLEYPVIFMVGMEDTIFPHANSMFDPQGLEEERRLCYVGITRARERLYLTHANQRSLFGQSQYNPPSRFLKEVPDECIRTEGVGSAGFGAAAPGRGRGSRGGSTRWSSGFAVGSSVPGGRVFGSGQRRTSEPKESLQLATGDVVDHKTFGRGTVLEVKGDRVSIRFDGQAGTKNLLIGYAPIRKVE